MLKRLHHSAHGLLLPENWRIRIVFWAAAIFVGLVASLFARAADSSNGLFHQLVVISPYLPLAVSPVVIMLAAWLTKRFVPGAEGSGISQCIAALDIREENVRTRLLNWRIALGKIPLTMLGLLNLGRLGRFPLHYIDRAMNLAGGAAGIAAAFKTPLADILFAIEEMSRSFEKRTSGTPITAVLLTGITSIALLGNYTYLGIMPRNVWVSTGLLSVLVCGVAVGLLGGVRSTLLVRGQRLIRPLYRRRTLLVAGACGLIIALLGQVSGGATYASGYEAARGLMQETRAVSDSFPYLKLLPTAVSYWSGIPEGLFAPSLTPWAGLGAHLAHLFPHTELAAMVQTPITAFVIAMEMTHNKDLLIPLMATYFIATAPRAWSAPAPSTVRWRRISSTRRHPPQTANHRPSSA